MNNNVELEGRPRPLSAGLWTLFSWLRREDRYDSSESISSAGSDRTVASFAFLTPAHYQPATTPVVLPPPGPPTDTYKKRVHDRNIRRQYDRDITLHRKYGLFKSGENTCGYDAFSLPPARRINGDPNSRWERERRATSECFHRRLAHVPGKRRAPLPPVPVIPTAPPSSLSRGNTRKRRAPQPPIKLNVQNKENINNLEANTALTMAMNSDKQKLDNDVSMGHKSEKYSKKEERSKDTKVKFERSFLKQIFDSKKRNSNIDITSVKLLPSISELDKQAAEIIEACKEKNTDVNNMILEKLETQRASQTESWICVSCLRKYSSSVNTCLHCIPKQKTTLLNHHNDDITSVSKALDTYTQTEKVLPQSMLINKNEADEKQKLKEMLKEMKDSLPKRAKHDLNVQKNTKNIAFPSSKPTSSYSTETPTLRVGSLNQNDNTISSSAKKTLVSNINKSPLSETIPVTRSQIPITVQPSSSLLISPVNNCDNVEDEKKTTNIKSKAIVNLVPSVQNVRQTKVINDGLPDQFKVKKDLHTPLKISSLLNPVYVPKNLGTNQSQTPNASQNNLKAAKENFLGQKISNVATSTSQTTENVSKSTTTNAFTRVTTSPNGVSVNATKESKLKTEVKNTDIQNKDREKPECSQINPISIITRKKTIPESKVDNNNVELMPSGTPNDESMHKNIQDQYSRRRNLIHQLEQSIAKGDENAAAEAAAKLAQLRLSCSVLSFSSQILSQPSTSTVSPILNGIEPNKSKNVSKHNNLLNTSLRIEPQIVQINPVKEISPQKAAISNVTSNADKVANLLGSGPTPNKSSIALQMNKIPVKPETIIDIKKEEPTTNYEMITIAVLVEDREATRGPVHLLIRRQALMRDLRREAEASLGVATNLQRWIVGRVLCVNDDTPVATLAGSNFSAPFYLCVVESETKTESKPQLKIVEKLNNSKSSLHTKTSNVYTELMELEQQALVPNTDNFECGVCMEEYTPGRGVVLRECVHVFCKDCLSDVVRHCEEPGIPCPAMGCRGMLQEREIRALVTPQDYERWLARGLAAAESGIRNAFHCRTRDCKGWVLCEPGVQRFSCPVCKHVNCVQCQAIHDGETCEEHKTKLKKAAAAGKSDNDDGTRTLLAAMITKGEALECPECSAIITKKWGCDWVKCSACKTEICWVTRGRRWGPGGKGDTSGGCRCGVDGKRCHPSCNYCH